VKKLAILSMPLILTLAILISPFSAGAAVGYHDAPDVLGVSSFVGYAPDKIVVKFDPSIMQALDKKEIPRGKTSIPALDQVGKRYGVKSIRLQFPKAKPKKYKGQTIDLSGWHKIKFAKKIDVISAVKKYKTIPGVLDAQPVSIHHHMNNFMTDNGTFPRSMHPTPGISRPEILISSSPS